MISLKNGLSSSQINSMLKDLRNFAGIYSKDLLPKDLQMNKWYVVNMQDSGDGHGTHWVCLKTGIPLTYFDSFGFPPPVEIMEQAKHGILYNKHEIQTINSTACGFFCVACIWSDSDHNMVSNNHFNRFINKFSNNTTINEVILRNILSNFGIG